MLRSIDVSNDLVERWTLGILPTKPVAIVPTVAATIVEVWTILNRYESSKRNLAKRPESEGDGRDGLDQRSSGCPVELFERTARALAPHE